MRLTPEIRFIHDDSIQRGEEVCCHQTPQSICCASILVLAPLAQDSADSKEISVPISVSVSVNEHAQDTIWDGMQVMAILDRIKQQDAGKIEPPAIALSGMVGANPASEGFMEQNASASRRQIQRAAAEADEEDGEVKEVWPHGSPEPNLPIMWETGPLTLTSAGNLSKYPSVHQLQRLRGVETAWVHKIG